MDSHQLDINTIETLEAMEYAPYYHQWILDEFSKHIGENIVEVGSGSGSISKKLLEANPKKLFCIEPSEMVYEKLSNTLNTFKSDKKITTDTNPLNCYLSETSEKLKQENIDTIIYINVLEHIEDHAQALKNMSLLLKDSGCLVLMVPALPAIYGTLDQLVGHYRRYTRTMLNTLLKDSGLRIEKQFYMNMFGIFSWFIAGRILKYKAFDSVSGQRLDRCVGIVEGLESYIKPCIGQSLITVCYKEKTHAT